MNYCDCKKYLAYYCTVGIEDMTKCKFYETINKNMPRACKHLLYFDYLYCTNEEAQKQVERKEK